MRAQLQAVQPSGAHGARCWLAAINPAVKLVSSLLLVVLIALYFDPYTPAAFLGLSCLVAMTLPGGGLATHARHLLPFFPIAIAIAFYYSILIRALPDQALTPLWTLGPAVVSEEGLRVGLSIAFRLLAIVSFSRLFVSTTSPTDLVVSLIRQGRVPYRFGFGVLAALRLLPLLESELRTIRMAHHVRGMGEPPGIAGYLTQAKRYAIPLLADAVRKAERTALAMDSRAFGAYRVRTYVHPIDVHARDWVFLGCTIAASAAIIAVLSLTGLLSGFLQMPH